MGAAKRFASIRHQYQPALRAVDALAGHSVEVTALPLHLGTYTSSVGYIGLKTQHSSTGQAYPSSMTDLSARVDALTNAARAVRLQLVDNWHKIIRIDAVSNSQHLT